MEAVSFLLTALMSAMFMGAAGNETELTVEQRCEQNSTAIFPHPGQCQLYYNCSNTRTPRVYFTQHLEECPYPQLFSAVTSRCMPFDDVICGDRQEHVNQCDYIRSRCGTGHCMPCWVWGPSCEGLSSGHNVYRSREWTPYFVTCRANRTLDIHLCPRHPVLEIAQFFHPEQLRCVSLYEIPREHGGLTFNCTSKTDGLHPDDVTSRPDVYFRCDGGGLVEGGVYRCERGQEFSVQQSVCVDTEDNN